MESLLRWSIEHSGTNDGPGPPPQSNLDPGVIDAILGKPDAVLMKEALAIGMDEHASIDARVTALDDLEMLVEQIDNATNLTQLQMYPQILSLLSPLVPDQVRMQALWILGTAVQNNLKAQADFLTHDPLPTILSILSPSSALDPRAEGAPSSQTRSKAAYALSASLKHNAAALVRFGDVGGWDVIRDSLQDSDITIRRKIAFLIYTLLLPIASSAPPSTPPDVLTLGQTLLSAPSPPHQQPSASISSAQSITLNGGAISPAPVQSSGIEPTSTGPLALEASRTHRIVPVLIESLTIPLPYGPDADEEMDADYAEKAARALVAFIEAGGELTPSEKNQMWASVVNDGTATREEWGLSDDEWEVLRRSVSGK